MGWFKGFAIICAVAAISSAYADASPVKDAESAIAIAKEVCRGKANPSAQWKAVDMADRPSWAVRQELPGGYGYVVMIPENGPSPTECRYVLDIKPKA